MNKIVASVKIFPEDIVISKEDLKEAIKRAIPESGALYRIDEEPIAFGLVALVARIAMPEAEGQMDKVEEALKSVENVGEIQVVNVWRT